MGVYTSGSLIDNGGCYPRSELATVVKQQRRMYRFTRLAWADQLEGRALHRHAPQKYAHAQVYHASR